MAKAVNLRTNTKKRKRRSKAEPKDPEKRLELARTYANKYIGIICNKEPLWVAPDGQALEQKPEDVETIINTYLTLAKKKDIKRLDDEDLWYDAIGRFMQELFETALK